MQCVVMDRDSAARPRRAQVDRRTGGNRGVVVLDDQVCRAGIGSDATGRAGELQAIDGYVRSSDANSCAGTGRQDSSFRCQRGDVDETPALGPISRRDFAITTGAVVG